MAHPQFALIGHPIRKSLSDVYHNKMLDKLNIPARYGKFDIEVAQLASFLSTAKENGMLGLSVTMPLKEVIIPLLDACDESAKAIGAVNTVKFEAGKAYGFNTDAIGARKALEEKLQGSLLEKKVVLVGAGGAAKAIAWSLMNAGAKVACTNRTYERAHMLAENLGAQAFAMDVLAKQVQEADILIQSTSVGMMDEQVILPANLIPSHVLVFEIISQPHNGWIDALAKKGCKIVTGKDMWMRQALAQYQIWMGQDFDQKAGQKAFQEILFESRTKPA